MDKRIIFAVAGSGKSRLIIDTLKTESRSLIVTYTIDNTKELEERIKSKFGCIPSNITLMTYFTFLYQFCFVPYLGYKLRPKGINYNEARYGQVTLETSKIEHYVSSNGYIYSNRIAKLVINSKSVKNVISRIEKYFDTFLVDEVQDFAANDFNLLLELCNADINLLFVGDFYQHTFDTSRDGQIRKNLHNDQSKYIKEFEKAGLTADISSLDKSYRCAPSVCSFITDKIGIQIESHLHEDVTVSFIESQDHVNELFNNDEIIKLFYQSSDKYSCYSKNWGKSKGQDCYKDLCVVLYKKAYDLYKKGKLSELPAPSKHKLYVACSRARGNLYLVPIDVVKKCKPQK